MDFKKGENMVSTEKELEKHPVTCTICNKSIKAGESYEKTKTHRKSNMVVHTDCIMKEGL